jgi:CubicO group peptidase (beta-lactamase class C family)
MPPEAEPGTVINYSPVCAHAILGEMVRRVDGGNRPFRRILADDVFEPLGMNDTAFGLRADLVQVRMTPLDDGRQQPVVRAVWRGGVRVV